MEINEFELFEQRVFIFLTHPFQYIPEDFWEPVVVSLNQSQLELLKSKLCKKSCIICTEEVYNFKVLPCCKNDTCKECTINWFAKSTKCPYCKQDVRDFI
jgi:hypothetical protein